MPTLKWLYPGLRIKRWVTLCSFAVLLVSMGFVLTITKAEETIGSLFVVVGICCLIISIRKIIKSVVNAFMPSREQDLLNLMYSRGVLNNGPRIVVIGGGTGLSNLLQGLKERTSNLTAIVTVTDDGGSSGRLRNQFNVLPAGDIRNCLVALADSEPMMRELFQFRFKEEASDLSGHNFGNLFILAMEKVTGDFEKAIQESSRILNIRGRVLPSTLTRVVLSAEHEDATITYGETQLASHSSPIRKLFLSPEMCHATEDAITAVERADAIVFGPGSLFTSVLPNLLISDLLQAVVKTNVPRIYVCNIMTQPNETTHLKTDFDHLDSLVRHTQPELVSHCIVNTGAVSPVMLKAYQEKSSVPVVSQAWRIRELGYKVIQGDLVSSAGFVRHSSRKLAKIITELAGKKTTVNGRSRRAVANTV
jgi:uncharacterized cofD-like protein